MRRLLFVIGVVTLMGATSTMAAPLWWYDWQGATTTNGQPHQAGYNQVRDGRQAIYVSPGSGSSSVIVDPNNAGNYLLRVRDTTTTSGGKPVWSNNNPPEGWGYALRDGQSEGFTMTFRLKAVSMDTTGSASAIDVVNFYHRLKNADPGVNLNYRDRNRFKMYKDAADGTIHLSNGQLGYDQIVSDAFHTIYLTSVLSPTDNTKAIKRLWVDGTLVSTTVCAFESKDRNCQFGFNDTAGKGEFQLDYISWTDETASAIPEPASMLILGSGVLLTLRRRWA